MYSVRLDRISDDVLQRIKSRVFVDEKEGLVYVPDVVAEKYRLHGEKITSDKVHIFLSSWNRLSRPFQLAVMYEFSLGFLCYFAV